MTRYSHTQRSRWTALVGIPLAVVALVGAIFGEPIPVAGRLGFAVVAVVLAWTMVNFSRLTVEVGADITVAFGSGWPHRSIDPSQVTASRVVRNSAWHGWGIRWYPRGAIWNVWGLDAVELDLATGRRFRIGTDEPEALLAAVRAVTAGQ